MNNETLDQLNDYIDQVEMQYLWIGQIYGTDLMANLREVLTDLGQLEARERLSKLKKVIAIQPEEDTVAFIWALWEALFSLTRGETS